MPESQAHLMFLNLDPTKEISQTIFWFLCRIFFYCQNSYKPLKRNVSQEMVIHNYERTIGW